MDLQTGRHAADVNTDMSVPDFTVYGLAGWDRARCVERWSGGPEGLRQLALGFGLRWDLDSGWVEVTTFRPSTEPEESRPGVRLSQESSALDRISVELEDLRTYGVTRERETDDQARSTAVRSLVVDGRAYVGEVVTVGPVSSLDVVVDAGSLVRLTWYVDPGRVLPALEPVTDLEPFVAGAVRDDERRRELFDRR